MKTAVVTGASGGIGFEVARLLCERGYTVYGFSRRQQCPDGATPICCDVTDDASVRAASEQVIAERGGIDLLVCCAGMGIASAAEMAKPDDIHTQLDVNLLGTDRVVRAVLPSMRECRRGRIVIVSSVAGVVPIPFQTWYSVTKAGLNSYALALQNEVRPYGVRIAAVMPGDIRTGFTDARVRDFDGNDAYDSRVSRSVAKMELDERSGMSPARAAAKIVSVAKRRCPKPLYAIGLSYSLVCVLIKLLPARLSNYIIYQLYAK